MSPSPKVYISGKLFDKSDAKISVFDHGLLYGDGVFEGIRAYSGTGLPAQAARRSLCTNPPRAFISRSR